MKIRATLAIGIALLFINTLPACRAPTPPPPLPRVTLRVGGSDAMQLVMRDLADAYQQVHPYVTVQVHGGNSSSGLLEFARGSLDLALVSRNPRADELKQPPARAVEIGSDGIVVLVHPSNPLANLSREQVAKIFAGEILKWSQLGVPPLPGNDDVIQVLSREDGSGTRAVFEEKVMAGQRVSLTALIQPSERDVIAYVASKPGAVGYAAFNIWDANARARAVALDNIAPTLAPIQTLTYPLLRAFYLVAPLDADPAVAEFLEFTQSAAGRAVIAKRIAPAQ